MHMPVNKRRQKRPLAEAQGWLRAIERGTLSGARKIDPMQRASLHFLLELELSFGDPRTFEKIIALLTK